MILEKAPHESYADVGMNYYLFVCLFVWFVCLFFCLFGVRKSLFVCWFIC